MIIFYIVDWLTGLTFGIVYWLYTLYICWSFGKGEFPRSHPFVRRDLRQVYNHELFSWITALIHAHTWHYAESCINTCYHHCCCLMPQATLTPTTTAPVTSTSRFPSYNIIQYSAIYYDIIQRNQLWYNTLYIYTHSMYTMQQHIIQYTKLWHNITSYMHILDAASCATSRRRGETYNIT